MATKKRYRIDDKKVTREYKIYDEAYDLYIKQSNILNAGSQGLNAQTILWDKPAIEAHLYELEGDGKGNCDDAIGKRTVPALIPAMKLKLDTLARKFESYKEQREAEGFETPDKEPVAIFVERIRTEARLDIYMQEAARLREWLSKNQVKVMEVANEKMLQYGALGNGRLQGGTLVELDFQVVEKRGDILVITESASPYRGMKVSDYRKFVVEPFCAEYYRKRRQLENQWNAERKENGRSNIQVPPGLGLRKMSKNLLPAWPEGVKNHLVKEKQEK